MKFTIRRADDIHQILMAADRVGDLYKPETQFAKKVGALLETPKGRRRLVRDLDRIVAFARQLRWAAVEVEEVI